MQCVDFWICIVWRIEFVFFLFGVIHADIIFFNVAFIINIFGIVCGTTMSRKIEFSTPMLSVSHDAIIVFKTLILWNFVVVIDYLLLQIVHDNMKFGHRRKSQKMQRV
jgi:hypothetical protein